MFCEDKHLAHVLDSELINPATRPHWGNLTQANCVFIIVAVTQAPCPCLVCLCVSDASSQPESQRKFLFCFSSRHSQLRVNIWFCSFPVLEMLSHSISHSKKNMARGPSVQIKTPKSLGPLIPLSLFVKFFPREVAVRPIL